MNILIIGDEPMLEFLEGVFAGGTDEVRAFASAAAGLEALSGWTPDLLLCDLDMAGGDCASLAWVLARIRSGLGRRARILLMSGEQQRLTRSCSAADGLLLKPFAADELVAMVALSR